MSVVDWLRTLGLACYAEAFAENEIDANVLPTLTADDLEAMGVTRVGHRRKLLNAIAALEKKTLLPEADAPPPSLVPAPIEAERRQLTLAFVDLVGSTDLSTSLDPEDMRDIIRSYQIAVTAEIEREGGHVAKYMGDGVLAYFGWPTAREDACERAVIAGLAVIKRVAKIAAPGGARLSARVGIATGVVIVGDVIGKGEARESGVVGNTPNLAARLQELAPAGGVVIAENTARLLGRLFELRNLGELELKGFETRQRAFLVLRETAEEDRYEALRAGSSMPFIGRKEEFRLLTDRWRRAVSGDGQVVQLIGEPGIGKSRLLSELRALVETSPHLRLRYFCAPHHQNSALYPCIQQLVRSAQLNRDDPPAQKLEKLRALLAQGTGAPEQVLPVIAALLKVPMADSEPIDILTPQRRKALFFEALYAQLDGLANARPVLMMLEDIQWLDPTSFELFDVVVNRIASRPVLLVATSRPEVQPRWMSHPHSTILTLNRLRRADTARMVEAMVDGQVLPATVLEHILNRTEGVPLFVEELTKVILESGVHLEVTGRFKVAPHAIPMTLQDSLMARLDRHAPVKEVAQIGSAIGREFSFELLAALSGLTEIELETSVARLVEAGLILERGGFSERVFAFKHALMQDAAYESMLKSKRQLLHARIAAVLEQKFPQSIEQHPEMLAHHCTEAGQIDKAVDFWRRACEVAINRSAMVEAIAHSQAGLTCVLSLPESPERNRQELAIQLAMGSALVAAHGFAAESTGGAYQRARELCEALGDLDHLYPVLYGLCLFHLYSGDLESARRNATQLMEMAETSNDSGSLFFAQRAAGVSDLPSGRFASARAHLEQALALYDKNQHQAPVFVYAFDPKVVCLDYLSRTLFPMGFLKQALARSAEATEAARQIRHQNSLALPLFFGGMIQQLCGRVDEVTWRADELLLIAEEEGFPLWAAGARILKAWSDAANGADAGSEPSLRQGIDDWSSTGAVYMLPYFLTLLADMRLRSGGAAEALPLLDDALARIERSGERWYEAEVHRTRGRAHAALYGRGNEEAKTCYARAFEVATGQGAALWALRAELDLHGSAAHGASLSAALDALPEPIELPEIRLAERLIAAATG